MRICTITTIFIMLTNTQESFMRRMFTDTSTVKNIIFILTGRTRIIDTNINYAITGSTSSDGRIENRAPENREIENAMSATTPRTKNLYNKMEWAGAFGDVGTLIPFVVAYITIVKVNPLGLLLMFGLALIASGVYYRTPLPIQPMKAIGAAAVAGGISPAALFGSGLTTGLFWLLAGVTGAIRPISRLATKPIVHGIMLGLAPAGWPGTFASGRRI